MLAEYVGGPWCGRVEAIPFGVYGVVPREIEVWLPPPLTFEMEPPPNLDAPLPPRVGRYRRVGQAQVTGRQLYRWEGER